MKYIYTKHSTQRLAEREIPNPEGLLLRYANKRLKRKIRESCQKEGCDTTKAFYYWSRYNGMDYIYVCQQIDEGVFLLITALKYEILK